MDIFTRPIHKIYLLAYYLAYKYANGKDKANSLRLSYRSGWYTIGSKSFGDTCKVRKAELYTMIETLWDRVK